METRWSGNRQGEREWWRDMELESVSLNILSLAFSITMDKGAKWLLWNLSAEKNNTRTRVNFTSVCQGFDSVEKLRITFCWARDETRELTFSTLQLLECPDKRCFCQGQTSALCVAPSHSSLLWQHHQMVLCFPKHELFLTAYLVLIVDEHPHSNLQASLQCEAVICTSRPSAEPLCCNNSDIYLWVLEKLHIID